MKTTFFRNANFFFWYHEIRCFFRKSMQTLAVILTPSKTLNVSTSSLPMITAQNITPPPLLTSDSHRTWTLLTVPSSDLHQVCLLNLRWVGGRVGKKIESGKADLFPLQRKFYRLKIQTEEELNITAAHHKIVYNNRHNYTYVLQHLFPICKVKND